MSGTDQQPAELPVREAPVNGVPSVTADPASLETVARALREASGPTALDAERASGFRYSQRAYLVQIHRHGSGNILIDPIALPDLSEINDAMGESEWILHAASQDLVCLAEVGLRPATLFDTELAARLTGHARVGLAAVVGDTLGFTLAKKYSAVDWSTRPLPPEWLTYAALDVDMLLQVRDTLAQELEEQGKTEIARQEFEHARTADYSHIRQEPWRRISKIHAIRDRRKLAIARSLWQARDQLARRRDIAQGRLLSDAGIVQAASNSPKSSAELLAIKDFAGPRRSRDANYWMKAIIAAKKLPEAELPALRGPASDGPPPAKFWSDRNPDAAGRLASAKQALAALSDERSIPVENLAQPSLIREIAWENPADISEAMEDGGARPWQIALLAPILAKAWSEH